MIGFESDLTGETAVTAITQAHELFSGDMTPARIRDVVEKFEKESGGYKEVNTITLQNGNPIFQPVIEIANSNSGDSVDLYLKGENFLNFLRTSNSNTTGFHRIKFINGAMFSNEHTDTTARDYFLYRDVYVDANVSGEKFYGEFLIPGIFKGVFSQNAGGGQKVLVKSILCPAPKYSIGYLFYDKRVSTTEVQCRIALDFFSDALLIYPKSFRTFISQHYIPEMQLTCNMRINFGVASSDLTAAALVSSYQGDQVVYLKHVDDHYLESFNLFADGQYLGASFSGSYSIQDQQAPDLKSYLEFCSDDDFINILQ